LAGFCSQREASAMEWVMVGLELGVAVIIGLAVYLTLKK
jgi:hypothetical protein